MIRFLAAATSSLIFLFANASAQAGTLIPVPNYPGSTSTTVKAINDNNVVAGEYTNPDGNTHGFYGALNGTYSSFDGGDGSYTLVNGINKAGWITGAYVDLDKCPDLNYCAFVRKPDGTLVTLTKDGDALQGIARQITNENIFVGFYINQATDDEPNFLGKNARYKRDLIINLPTAQVEGINKERQVVGYYPHDSGIDSGFIQQKGKDIVVDYPHKNVLYTILYGVNDTGTTVGSWLTGSPTYVRRGFEYDIKTKTFRTLKIKGSKGYTYFYGINNAGYIAINSDAGNFIYCPKKKSECPGGTIDASFGPPIRANGEK